MQSLKRIKEAEISRQNSKLYSKLMKILNKDIKEIGVRLNRGPDSLSRVTRKTFITKINSDNGHLLKMLHDSKATVPTRDDIKKHEDNQRAYRSITSKFSPRKSRMDRIDDPLVSR